MKKRTFFLSLLAALLVLAGCKPELITEENTLRLSQYKVTFEADKGSQTVKVVTSSAAPWTTMSAEESTWLALEKGEDGTTLTITAETNTTAAERRAKVIIVCLIHEVFNIHEQPVPPHEPLFKSSLPGLCNLLEAE